MIEYRRRVWRFFYWLRFQLWQRHRFNQLVIERVAGRPFVVLPHVFNPSLFLSSEFMVTALNAQLIPRQARVLDMGTGSGVGAVFAAQWAREVVALDVNETAVRCARINALLNEVDGQMQVLVSDLFEAVRDQTFDVILFNPPYYRGQPQDLLDKAFHATDVVERFAVELPHHLAPQGYALLLLSSTTDEASFLRLFVDNFVVKTAAQRQLPGERLTLYQLQPIPILSPPPREPFA